MFNIPVPSLPDDIQRQVRRLPAQSFAAASLGAWLEMAQAAGVEAVPATRVGRLDIEALLRFEEPEHAPTMAAMGALEAINQDLAPGDMLRWDCCAGLDVKLAMGHGELPEGQSLHLHPGDPRAFDLLYDFPDQAIDIWKRPWIRARTIEAFPVEFRVFIVRGQVVGIANYYLQRDLPAGQDLLEIAERCVGAAQAMLDAMNAKGVRPAMPGMTDEQLDEFGLHASLDFMLADDGRLLFLEGGPGFGFGAHPCAFLDQATDTVDPIEGLKLASGQPALPLPAKQEPRSPRLAP